MTTREQINVIAGAIQEGMTLPGSDRDLRVIAAHVVAALTNAGKTIVELPEADEVQKALDAYAITVDPVFPILLHQNPGPYLSAEKARRFAAALLAAARVAEGGA